MVGIDWPNIDEDDLRSTGDTFRQIAQELTGDTGDAKSDIEQLLQNNTADSLDLFEALWNKLSGSHLPQVATGMNVLADALDVGAVVVVGMKVAAIAQLAILAAEIISDQAEAVVTFGASEALIPVQTMATREIMKTILDKAVQEAEQQLLGAVEGPVIDALTSAGEELAGQLVGDALGTSSGIDLGKVASAGGSSFEDGVKSVTSDPLGAVGLTNGSDDSGGGGDSGGGDSGGGDSGGGDSGGGDSGGGDSGGGDSGSGDAQLTSTDREEGQYTPTETERQDTQYTPTQTPTERQGYQRVTGVLDPQQPTQRTV